MQVLKFLMESNSISALHGQVTVGTLILQVTNCGHLPSSFYFEGKIGIIIYIHIHTIISDRSENWICISMGTHE